MPNVMFHKQKTFTNYLKLRFGGQLKHLFSNIFLCCFSILLGKRNDCNNHVKCGSILKQFVLKFNKLLLAAQRHT